MHTLFILVFLTICHGVVSQPGKCDQTPPHARSMEPSENKNYFKMYIESQSSQPNKYVRDQTYVIRLEAVDNTRPFRAFMVTAESPKVDDQLGSPLDLTDIDVGDLKTIGDDSVARYSELCSHTVENKDITEKRKVELHWISPKRSNKGKDKVRIRAMVAENNEAWYTGDELTLTLEESNTTLDDPPYQPVEECPICSEARYEVIFKGVWSRGTHHQRFPSKPDDTGWSHMIGASHDLQFELWKQSEEARKGLKELITGYNITILQNEIIDAMNGEFVRTFIRGKERMGPRNMDKPSHALFRVDKKHHLFSVLIVMRPSPDWFLGTSMFELCANGEWLREYNMKLYPWDAGVIDGVTYELKEQFLTNPQGKIERVAMDSFNKDSPFYQINIEDLKHFATLDIRLLDVFPLNEEKCSQGESEENEKEEENEEEDAEVEDEPEVAASRQRGCVRKWTDWSPCLVDDQDLGCGKGSSTRVQFADNTESDELGVTCIADKEWMQTKDCYVHCA